MRRIVIGLISVVVGLLFIAITLTTAYALQSTHFKFNETTLGGTGLLDTQSADYQASQTASILGLGSSASTNFQIQAGGQTTSDPALVFAITSSAANFSQLFSPTTASVAVSAFEVADYTSYGYAVQVIGNPPSYGSHTIAAMNTTGPSQVGVEQFGINLVANTSPTSVGANPNHGQFGFGSAASNYGTANHYRYVSGETIATGPKSSGLTIYTISYLINVSSITPGGQYSANETLVCTGTF